jgi:hypothetical protein
MFERILNFDYAFFIVVMWSLMVEAAAPYNLGRVWEHLDMPYEGNILACNDILWHLNANMTSICEHTKYGSFL